LQGDDWRDGDQGLLDLARRQDPRRNSLFCHFAEIDTKGADARFVKVGKGKFARKV
jgi:hypothetical protein